MRLRTTQPSVSAWIRALETEAGVPLLERNRRGVRLTEAGAVFLGHARETLRQGREALLRARQAGRGETGRLRLGYTPLTSYAGMPILVQRFRAAYPDAIVELTQSISSDLEAALVAERIDVALLHPPLQEGGDLALLDFEPDELVLALPTASPLSSLDEVPLAALEGQPFLMGPRTLGPHIYDRIILAFREAGFGPSIVQEVAGMETLIGLAAAGIGCGFVIRSLAVIRRPGVVYRPLVGANLPTLPIALAWRRDGLPAIASRLCDLACESGEPWRRRLG